MMGFDFASSTELISNNFGQDAMYSLSSKKAQEELNWQPNKNLQDGIREMILWIEENWEEIKQQPLEYIHKI